MASARQVPHISGDGCKEAHTAGRSGELNMVQRISASRWIQGTPAALPSGIPGMGELMDGAIQQAPQKALHLQSRDSDFAILYFSSRLNVSGYLMII